MEEIRKFLYIESDQVPLNKLEYGTIKKNIINPITGKPYKGIVLEGVFADFGSNNPNNNNRIYDLDSYLRLLQALRQKVLSPKGVYGEFEHPDRYSVDNSKASHKILDVWFDEQTRQVMGYVLLLNNTEAGRAARDIIESGGRLAISARAAGEEKQMPDGTKLAIPKLLVTYDLVTHPGFDSAILEFKELNESEKMYQQIGDSKRGFSCIIYDDQLRSINPLYDKFSRMNESNAAFYDWYSNVYSPMSESQKITKQQKQQNKAQQKQLEDNEPMAKEKAQNALKTSSNQLNQNAEKPLIFRQMALAQQRLKEGLVKKGYFTYHDNAAGFMTYGMNIGANTANISQDEEEFI